MNIKQAGGQDELFRGELERREAQTSLPVCGRGLQLKSGVEFEEAYSQSACKGTDSFLASSWTLLLKGRRCSIIHVPTQAPTQIRNTSLNESQFHHHCPRYLFRRTSNPVSTFQRSAFTPRETPGFPDSIPCAHKQTLILSALPG